MFSPVERAAVSILAVPLVGGFDPHFPFPEDLSQPCTDDEAVVARVIFEKSAEWSADPSQVLVELRAWAAEEAGRAAKS